MGWWRVGQRVFRSDWMGDPPAPHAIGSGGSRVRIRGIRIGAGRGRKYLGKVGWTIREATARVLRENAPAGAGRAAVPTTHHAWSWQLPGSRGPPRVGG